MLNYSLNKLLLEDTNLQITHNYCRTSLKLIACMEPSLEIDKLNDSMTLIL